MQIIDVTLRDGGHVREFNWPIKFAQDHYKSLCKIPSIKYIELGFRFSRKDYYMGFGQHSAFIFKLI